MAEASLVVLILFTVCSFAMLNLGGILPRVGANTALSQTVAQLRRGRETAVAQRRNVEVKFLGNNEIQLVRSDVPAGTTVLRLTFSRLNLPFTVLLP